MNKTPKKNALSSIDDRAKKKPKSKPARSSPSVSEAEGASDSHLAGIDVTPGVNTTRLGYVVKRTDEC